MHCTTAFAITPELEQLVLAKLQLLVRKTITLKNIVCINYWWIYFKNRRYAAQRICYAKVTRIKREFSN
jgi:hypothetical protein